MSNIEDMDKAKNIVNDHIANNNEKKTTFIDGIEFVELPIEDEDEIKIVSKIRDNEKPIEIVIVKTTKFTIYEINKEDDNKKIRRFIRYGF